MQFAELCKTTESISYISEACCTRTDSDGAVTDAILTASLGQQKVKSGNLGKGDTDRDAEIQTQWQGGREKGDGGGRGKTEGKGEKKKRVED